MLIDNNLISQAWVSCNVKCNIAAVAIASATAHDEATIQDAATDEFWTCVGCFVLGLIMCDYPYLNTCK